MCLSVYCDSDWAGCIRTRRSTSGGVLKYGEHILQHWSRTQSTVALSSGEAELNAALKGGAEALYLLGIIEELVERIPVTLYGDSTASRGILLREGAGPVKHLDVKQLWLQERVAREEISVEKIIRSENPGDALTHHWTNESSGHYGRMGLTRPVCLQPGKVQRPRVLATLATSAARWQRAEGCAGSVRTPTH